jgi:hypothetical protein
VNAGSAASDSPLLGSGAKALGLQGSAASRQTPNWLSALTQERPVEPDVSCVAAAVQSALLIIQIERAET